MLLDLAALVVPRSEFGVYPLPLQVLQVILTVVVPLQVPQVEGVSQECLCPGQVVPV